jgi:hypothetical protein
MQSRVSKEMLAHIKLALQRKSDVESVAKHQQLKKNLAQHRRACFALLTTAAVETSISGAR